MPIKVTCDECGATFGAPDAARGKAVKCKECGERVRVPRGAGGSKAGPRKRKKAARPKKSVDDDDFFSGLDLGRAEDFDVRVCPKCAAEVDEEDIECPSCGVNLETGVMSQKQKRLRRSKGPDPDEFYQVAWKDSWEFMTKNAPLAIKLGLNWATFFTIFVCSLFMIRWVDQEKVPLVAFWTGLTFVSFCASMGAYWQVLIGVIKATAEKRDEMDRFEFDFFSSVALGIKIFAWPYILAGLVLFPANSAIGALFQLGHIDLDDVKLYGAICAGIYLLSCFCFPVAMSHLAAKYTYKAYIPYYMAKITFSNMKATFFFWMIAILFLIPTLGLWIPLGASYYNVMAHLRVFCFRILSFADISTSSVDRGFFFYVTMPVVAFITIWVACAIASFLTTFPGLFIMRLNGLFAYYNDRTLQTKEDRRGGDPAGFWIRYLQYFIDSAIIGVFVGISSGLFFGLMKLVIYLEYEDHVPTILNVARLVAAVIPIVYFVLTEGGPSRATLGMNGVGLVVIDEYGNRLSYGTAFMRYIGRIVCNITLGIGYLIVAFDKHKMGLHHKMTRTHVVYRKEQL